MFSRGNVGLPKQFISSSWPFVATLGHWRGGLLEGRLTSNWLSIREVTPNVHITLLNHNGVWGYNSGLFYRDVLYSTLENCIP